jgi:hypothetical protein
MPETISGIPAPRPPLVGEDSPEGKVRRSLDNLLAFLGLGLLIFRSWQAKRACLLSINSVLFSISGS